MLLSLLKVKLYSVFVSMFRGSKTMRKRGVGFKVLICIFALYVVGCVFLMFGTTAFSVCKPLTDAGLGWLYFGMFYILTVVLVFLLSLYMAKGVLYDAKDNEMLLSMPIKPGEILISRLLSLLALDYLYSAFVLIPAGVVYFYVTGPTVVGIAAFIVCFLAAPLLALTLTCIFGWVLAWLTAKLGNEKYITMVFSVIILVVYFYFYSKFNTYIELIIANGADIGATLQAALPPVYYFGTAIADINYVNLFLFLACSLVPIALVFFVLKRSFIRLATDKKGAKKKVYEKKELKVSSPRIAFIKRELVHYASNPMYILNGTLGVFLMLIAAVLLIVKQDYVNLLLSYIPGGAQYATAVAALALCCLTGTDVMSAPSISLEGKSLWITQSLPVSAGEVLLAKVDCHVIVCLPSAVLLSLVLAFLLPNDLFSGAMLILAPTAMTVFIGFLGVVVNLKFPKFDWTNETAVIKQGMATMITMFSSWGVVALGGLLYGFLLKSFISQAAYMAIYSAILIIGCVIMRAYLKGKGAKIYDTL